ncbi:acetate kinase [Saonia flava]|uniref:Acetate kinase n=1 Tax=Saonia flava TaxID=523696 RepID=A0A846QTU5_9FLAO|nr:acetate kinase [Saonia flava]NJB70390.1 acetate kinase [Saonia flava]
MKVLVINSGSSSIKYQLMEMPSEKVICEGIIERIGSKKAVLKYKRGNISIEEEEEILTHTIGLKKIAAFLLDSKKGVITDVKEIDAVGHRVVHGGNVYSKTTIVNQGVKEKINEYSILAPLHNPHNLEGIVLAEQIFNTAHQVAVFDTAFHQTIPTKAKKYAIPNELYTNHGIQVYGFHGTSHKYVSEKAIDYLQNPEAKIISIHLGNGCSITAVKNGKSVDHSLGFTPSNGLIMGSRSGDIDHSIIFHFVKTLGYDLDKVEKILLKKSGMLGLTGYSDLRDVQSGAEQGNTDCILALEMNAYRIKKYIGAYAAIMNGLDAILFTAGIGENSSVLRELVCSDMDYLGINLDQEKNKLKSNSLRDISISSSKVKIFVIPTNEELEIAKQVFQLVR